MRSRVHSFTARNSEYVALLSRITMQDSDQTSTRLRHVPGDGAPVLGGTGAGVGAGVKLARKPGEFWGVWAVSSCEVLACRTGTPTGRVQLQLANKISRAAQYRPTRRRGTRCASSSRPTAMQRRRRRSIVGERQGSPVTADSVAEPRPLRAPTRTSTHFLATGPRGVAGTATPTAHSGGAGGDGTNPTGSETPNHSTAERLRCTQHAAIGW